MEELYVWLRFLHIICGTCALASGTFSILNKKGSMFHRITGNVFVFALLITAFSAIIVTQIPGHENMFLMIIGVFSAYLASSGYRALFIKRYNPNPEVKVIDWFITALMGIFSLYFFVYGLKVYFLNHNVMGVMAIIFGLIACFLVFSDYKTFTTEPKTRHFWLFRHIIRMVSGVIATYTAFLVVNNTYLPPLVAWLAPTVIGTFVIFGFIRYYKTKFNKGEHARDILIVKIN